MALKKYPKNRKPDRAGSTGLKNRRQIFITSHPLISDVLAGELQAMGLPVKNMKTTGVETEGTLQDTYRLNLSLTTANRVLYQLFACSVKNPEELYKAISQYPWEHLLDPDGYFSIHSTVRNPAINDTRIVNLKAKDAIVDRLRKITGRRPDSGSEYSGAVFSIHWQDDNCIVYLDTSGKSIAKHGYRKVPHKAPLQEALAAAIIHTTRWDSHQPFVNPMCGAGTLAIEAAMLASGRKPGLYRDNYGFMHVRNYDEKYYNSCLKEIKESLKMNPVEIISTDHDAKAISAARQNARHAAVDKMIRFEVCDFASTPLPEEAGVVILNPEYGQRLGEIDELEKTYRKIGDFFKQKCSGYKGYIFTGNPDLSKKVGLRTKRKIPFYNGKIECRLLEYEIYKGSLKIKRNH